MAVMPKIAMQGKVLDAGKVFSNILMNVENLDSIKKGREQTPVRQRLLEAQTQATEAAAPTDIKQFNERQQQLVTSVAGVARQIIPDLKAGKIERVRSTLQNRLLDLRNQGLPTIETEEGLALLDSDPNELIRQSQNAIELDERGSKKTGLASAKTDILETGATIQSLPSGQVVVRNAEGSQVEGQDRLDVLNKAAQTKQDRLQQQSERTVETARKIEQVKDSTATADKAFGMVDKIRENIANLEQVTPLIGEGADTGPITQFFPSYKAATIKLEQLQKRLSLDVVGAVTFGALSKGELDLAKAVALPLGLKGDDLIKWTQDTISAKKKLANYYEEQAIFLGQGNSQSDWIKHKRTELKKILKDAGATESNIKQTMKDNNMSRSQVITEIRRRAAGGK